MGAVPPDDSVRHSQRLRVGVFVHPDRGDDVSARPYLHGRRCRTAAAAGAKHSDLHRLHRNVRSGIGIAGRSDGGGPTEMTRFWRILAPLAVGVVFLALWEALVRAAGI